ncbi:hypothetical protein [Companilactobacillus muriivasis]
MAEAITPHPQQVNIPKSEDIIDYCDNPNYHLYISNSSFDY